MRAAVVLMFGVIAAGCSDRSGSNAKNATSIEADDSASSPDSAYWKPASSASYADKATMVKWYQANDDCVGGIKLSPDDPVCKDRDKLEVRLLARGWCWSWTNKSDADNEWHRCSENGGPKDVGKIAQPVGQPTSTEPALADLEGHGFDQARLNRVNECEAAIRSNLDDPSSGEFPDVKENSTHFLSTTLVDGRLTESFPMRARNQFGALVKMVGFCAWRTAGGKIVLYETKAS